MRTHREIFFEHMKKHEIMSALNGHVPRPTQVSFQANNGVECSVGLEDFLRQHPLAYLKSLESTVGGGHGIMRVMLGDNELVLTMPRDSTRKKIERGLRMLWEVKPTEALHYHTNSQAITIPIMKTRLAQPLSMILSGLIRSVLEPGHYSIEAEVNIPNYNGKTWEIRNVYQCPEGVPRFVTSFAKVGAVEGFCHYSLGGTTEDSAIVVSAVYESLGWNQPDIKAERYLAKNMALAEKSAQLFFERFRQVSSRVLPEGAKFYPREFAVDIIAEQDGLELNPLVMEVQYPLGYMSYKPELLEDNPDLLAELDLNLQNMREDAFAL